MRIAFVRGIVLVNLVATSSRADASLLPLRRDFLQQKEVFLSMTSRSDQSPTDAIAAVSEGLEIPAHKVPVPTTVSPEMQTIIGALRRPASTLRPRTIEEWKSIVDASAATAISAMPGLCKRLRVKFETTRRDGVRAYSVTPEDIAPEN